MSTQTVDRDPFERGGWNGETANEGVRDSASSSSVEGIQEGSGPTSTTPVLQAPTRTDAMPDGSNLLRDDLLRNAAPERDLAIVAGILSAEPAATDPVTAMIAEHAAVWDKVRYIDQAMPEDKRRERELYDMISATAPVTLAGAIAQLEFAAEWDDPEMVLVSVGYLRTVLATV